MVIGHAQISIVKDFVVDIYDFDLGQLRSNVPKFTFFLF